MMEFQLEKPAKEQGDKGVGKTQSKNDT